MLYYVSIAKIAAIGGSITYGFNYWSSFPCNDLAEELLLGQYGQEMRSYAASVGFHVIDFHVVMVDESGIKIKAALYCDGIHPS